MFYEHFFSIVSEKPVGMGKSIVYLLALFLGALLSFAYVIIKSMQVKTVESESDVKDITSIPIFAKIPFQKTRDNLVIDAGNRSPIAERFRLLRTNVQFLLTEETNKPIDLLKEPQGQTS